MSDSLLSGPAGEGLNVHRSAVGGGDARRFGAQVSERPREGVDGSLGGFCRVLIVQAICAMVATVVVQAVTTDFLVNTHVSPLKLSSKAEVHARRG